MPNPSTPPRRVRFATRYRHLIRCALAAAVLAALAFGAFFVDLAVTRWALASRLGVEPAWRIGSDVTDWIDLTEVFGHGYGALMIFLAVFLLDVPGRRFLPRMIAATATAGIVGNLAKCLIPRIRPRHFLHPLALPETTVWDAFLGPPRWPGGPNVEAALPSGHTALAVGLAMALAWRYPRGRWYFAFLAAVVAVQRVVSGNHWLSDTLLGAALAVMVAGAILYWPWRPPWVPSRTPASPSGANDPELSGD